MRVVSCVLLVLLLFSIGCSSSYEVSSSPDADPSFNTFNVDAYDRSGTIVFQDGRELGARNIMVSQDSTRFLNKKTYAASVVPTHTIKKVVIINHGVGFLEGLGWGAGIGIVSGATLGVIGSTSKYSGSTAEDVAWATLTVGAMGAAVGGAIGGIWGVIAGHSYEYEFPLTKGRE
jgi:hypothetical protein